MVTFDTQNIDIHQDISQSWQEMVNLISEISQIPATLIMRTYPKEIEVFISSNTPHNPYQAKERERLGMGLYCESVITGKKLLTVNDATQDPHWSNNPDIKLGMIAYLGLPLSWPNGDVFGTICMLDSQPMQFDNPTKQLLTRFKLVVETDLKRVYQQAQLVQDNQRLIQQLHKKSFEFDQLQKQARQDAFERTYKDLKTDKVDSLSNDAVATLNQRHSI
ncbi:GAF domain-containing protein [Shewanella gelidimarina]|uniref:GAF domain-containing protein n=1 Tax=Shewanella gelidimarina TaxID=56813 RepID=UPI00200E1632|nr:GAF domain-containing protein [Shewanella gelidimarina]MCL1057250.1 GAF domain-containing protein [Shewanella gelidimarina]